MDRSGWVVLIVPLALAACATAGSQYSNASYQRREVLEEPVIQAEDSILSEDAIRRLLSSKIVLPSKAKLAVVNLGHRSPSSYTRPYRVSGSSEFLQNKREMLDAIEQPLWKLGRFTEITHVPKLLVPRRTSIVRLREAAALMQAELLLIYESRSQLVTDYRTFTKDEVHAHATIDVMLMDVKTGAIPYVVTIEATHTEKELPQDVEVFETRKRADKAVTLKVLRLAVEELTGFLEG